MDTDLSVADHTTESTHGVLKPLPVDELSIEVTKFLNIQDDTKENSNSSPPHKVKDACNYNSHQTTTTTTTRSPEKCLGKSATFPCPSQTHDENVKSVDQSSFRSISLPTHLKAVSAMKGSREKRGVAPPVKLRVKWAPDVYDPIPTSVSHVVTSNRSSRHSSNKKNSRNKQKNGGKSSSSSRGSKGKEKKQVRKRGGNSSSTGYKLSQHEEEDEEAVVFHDQFCGSSFLKGYGTKLHLSSVAEAT